MIYKGHFIDKIVDIYKKFPWGIEQKEFISLLQDKLLLICVKACRVVLQWL